jgi:DNA methylase
MRHVERVNRQAEESNSAPILARRDRGVAVGHLLTATQQEPPRPPSQTRRPLRSPLEMPDSALSQLAWAHAHETLLWASMAGGSRHTFNYDLINSRDPTSQLSSVWHIPSVPNREKLHGYHPTQKPLRLLRRALLASSREGDLVFDPFCGSGTSGVASKELGRFFVGAEKEEEYAELAARRIGAADRGVVLRDPRPRPKGTFLAYPSITSASRKTSANHNRVMHPCRYLLVAPRSAKQGVVTLFARWASVRTSARIRATTRHIVGEAQSLTGPRALSRHPTGRGYAGCCIRPSEKTPAC